MKTLFLVLASLAVVSDKPPVIKEWPVPWTDTRPRDPFLDPTTNRMYVSDGYGNRRVVIVDAATGKYIGHFGAYGNNPVDDKAAAAAGLPRAAA